MEIENSQVWIRTKKRSSYMKIENSQVWIRTKKRTELQKCNEVKKNSMHEEKTKVCNGRTQKIQGYH
ncbi:hypothetical protein BRADI_4g38228v3 [Brachypodium distachyon]|uniref:Uncharacterized protein n=1 Tax=Brachypodium distachyon TaxID=15368 RepID=A0A2K2CT29_BRADI|nr:hypothetical protein BRADI_4g38228v3 [Brachypodium distachyon]